MRKAIIPVVIFLITCIFATTPVWADASFGKIAYAEYKNGAEEYPAGSDCVKYNEWYYHSRVSNYFDHGEYIPQYDWNATFVSWCADRAGYILASLLPRTNDPEDLFLWCVGQGYPVIYPPFLITEVNATPISANDLMFSYTESGDRRVAIVTFTDLSGFSGVVGDVDGKVVAFHRAYSELSDDVCFIHIPTQTANQMVEIIRFLRNEMELNPAAVCGIAANIAEESNGSPYCMGDKGYSVGICQWHNGRFAALIRFCDAHGYEWYSLDGQLQYLKYELEGSYRGLLDMINSSEDSQNGAYEAAYLFCVDFERPDDTAKKAEQRGQLAQENFLEWYGL